MSTNHDATIYLSFAPAVSDEGRVDLATRLQDVEWSVRQGLAQQTRSDTLVLIVACLTLVGSGFGQRFGEVAADRVLTVLGAALSWLRGREASPRELPAAEEQPGTAQVEVVDIVDKESGLVIRLSGAEPDTTLAVLRTLLEDRRVDSDKPVTWDGESWN